MKIRSLKKKDALACSKIAARNYSREDQRMSYEEIMSQFSNSAIKPKFYVVEYKKEIVAFGGCVQTWADYDIYQIFWVNVSPDYQQQGIGKKLVKRLIAEIKKNKKAQMIHLTATNKNSVYYKDNFGFKTLKHFKKGMQHFMALDLKK